MANTLKIKRGTAATIPQGQLAEPLFTTDTYDLYIGKGSGGNQRFQKYIASGTSSQFLKGDGSLDSTTYQATSEKGQNNGYASLDAGGKIPVSQLPSSVIEYKGTWNASTNTPTLADGTGDAGDVYIVSVGGTQNLGSGSITFAAGDWVMYNGSVWQKSTGSNAVASVNGQTGIVVLDTDDISEPISATNLWFTNARARTAISLTTTGSSGMATYDNMTGILNVPNYSISGLGGVPTSRTLTINGTAFDLSADRTWSVGTVTSVAALTIGTSGTDITSTVATGTTTPVITLNIPTASATNRGALSSADWSAFNGKQAALNGTGFVKISGTTISYDNTSYLPLTGGTLTGTLNGTNSVFSSSISAYSGEVIIQSAGTNNSWVGNNFYYDNDFKYTRAGFAQALYFDANDFEIRVANTGAANALITWNVGLRIISSSGNVIVPTGTFSVSSTASASAFIPTGSTVPTNGMYLPSANTVAFAANSTRVIQISDSGRVSIGATTPTTDTLTVHGAITTTNGGKITAQGMIEAGSTIFGGLNCIITSDLSAASITPTGSTSPVNGMYLPSANTIAFSTLASPRLTIASNGAATFSSSVTAGNVIIAKGDWTSTYPVLQLQDTRVAGRDWNIENGRVAGGLGFYQGFGTSFGTKLFIAEGGNVGIGTTNPTGAAGLALVLNSGASQGRICIKTSATGDASGDGLQIGMAGNDAFIEQRENADLTFATNASERMRITNLGAVQITNNLTANSPSGGNTGEGIIAGRSFKLDASGSGQRAAMYVVSNTLSDTYGSGLQIQFANLADTLGFGFNLTTGGAYETYMKSGGSWNRAMTITSGGNVGIGTTSPVGALQVSNGTVGTNLGAHVVNITGNNYTNATIGVYDAATLAANTGGGINFGAFYTGTTFTEFAYIRTNKDNATSGDYGGSLIFATRPNGGSPTERMRITSGGSVLINKTSDDTTSAGVRIGGNEIAIARSGGSSLICDRLTNDGNLVVFRQDNADEGSISVAGNTVSYNSFLGSHWSQLSDNTKPVILKGTVLEAIDEMCIWEGEKNDRLPKSKISDTIESENVYGVFLAWDEDWKTSNDFYVASVGLGYIRVNKDAVIKIGDLLQSNGDGTAKVQDDNVVKSSTIAKVVSTNKIETYSDGSYLIAATLHCG